MIEKESRNAIYFHKIDDSVLFCCDKVVDLESYNTAMRFFFFYIYIINRKEKTKAVNILSAVNWIHDTRNTRRNSSYL